MAHPQSNPRSVLIVEGRDDNKVVENLYRRCRNATDLPFQISEAGGFGGVIKEIRSQIESPGRSSVGILVDANDSISERWQQIADEVTRANINVPSQPDPGGTVIYGKIPIIESDIKVGIWLMPDNKSAGEIEDFVTEMIPSGDPVWPLAQGYVNGIPTADRVFDMHKCRKSQLYAWLATREEPRLMGWAIENGDLNTHNNACLRFASWLKELFEE